MSFLYHILKIIILLNVSVVSAYAPPSAPPPYEFTEPQAFPPSDPPPYSVDDPYPSAPRATADRPTHTTNTAKKIENYCVTQIKPQRYQSALCPEVVLPIGKTRNLDNEHLFCGESSALYQRRAIPFDAEHWNDLRRLDRQQAIDMLRQQPQPQWSGTINYPINLEWQWEKCELITDEKRCGYDTIVVDVRQADGSILPKEEKKARQCYVDVKHNGSMFCGSGRVDYSVLFERRDTSTWGPSHPQFNDRLANGYDLLPGETEDIQVSNKTSFLFRDRLSPGLVINNPKYSYKIHYAIENDMPNSLQCRYRGYDQVHFFVHSSNRIAASSPNGFGLPIGIDGHPIEALQWVDQANGAQPYMLLAQDYSAEPMGEISDEVQKKLHNIEVKVELYKEALFGKRFISKVYVDDIKSIQQNLNALSDQQAIRRSTLWGIPLSEGDDPNTNLYRQYLPAVAYYPMRLLWHTEELSYPSNLEPNTNYILQLTVYHKGLSFYHQACKDTPDDWDCRWYALWGWLSPNRYERNYFSDRSYDVAFRTGSDTQVDGWRSIFWRGVYAAQIVVPASALVYMLFNR